MRYLLLALLLCVPTYADPPKFDPPEAKAEARDLLTVKVAPDKGKDLSTVVVSSPDAKYFTIRRVADEPGSYDIYVRPGTPSGSYSIQAWHAGDSLVLPKQGPLPALPVSAFKITVGEITPPKPDPKPDPKPTPDVIPSDSLRVLIIEESAERTKLKPGMLNAMFAEEVHNYIFQKQGYLRVYDKDDNLAGEKEWYQKAAKLASGQPLPYLVIGNGRTQYAGAMSDSVDGMLNLLKKYGE